MSNARHSKLTRESEAVQLAAAVDRQAEALALMVAELRENQRDPLVREATKRLGVALANASLDLAAITVTPAPWFTRE